MVSGLTEKGKLSETYKHNLINELNGILSLYITNENDLNNYSYTNTNNDIIRDINSI